MYLISLWLLKQLKLIVGDKQLCVLLSIYVDCWYVGSYLCAILKM